MSSKSQFFNMASHIESPVQTKFCYILCFLVVILIDSMEGAAVIQNVTNTEEIVGPLRKSAHFDKMLPLVSTSTTKGEENWDLSHKDESGVKRERGHVVYARPPPGGSVNFDIEPAEHRYETHRNYEDSNNVDEDEDEEQNQWNSVDLWEPHEERKKNELRRPPPPPPPMDDEVEEKEDDDDDETTEGSENNEGWLEGLELDRRGRRILNRVMDGVNTMCSTLFPFVEAMGRGGRFCVKRNSEYLPDDVK